MGLAGIAEAVGGRVGNDGLREEWSVGLGLGRG